MKCRICGSDQMEEPVYAREMMIPTRETFAYRECRQCHCLQIEEIPENLGEYYGEDYYSFQSPQLSDPQVIKDDVTEDREGTERKKLDMTSILDVGCGAGKFLQQLRSVGYGNLRGCDPFLAHDIVYGEEIHIYKKTIHEMDGKYDKIFFNDSFEHVTDPHEVMESVKRLINPGGIVRIAIPVFPNIAYDMFDGDWYQMDAPRHIFLHSVQSMELLAKLHGFRIVDVSYDADPSQIYRSFLYTQDIPFWDQKMTMVIDKLGREEVDEIASLTKEANEKGFGDHAVFCLMPV